MNWADFFEYDKSTGCLIWKAKRRKVRVGEEAGSIKHDGRYRTVVLMKKRYYVHRIIWELVNGSIPSGMCIDHIDGNGLNNKLENLRTTSLSGNQRNRRLSRNCKTGINGVIAHKGGFSVHCANKYITYSKDFFEACCARKSAEQRMGFHANQGRSS